MKCCATRLGACSQRVREKDAGGIVWFSDSCITSALSFIPLATAHSLSHLITTSSRFISFVSLSSSCYSYSRWIHVKSFQHGLPQVTISLSTIFSSRLPLLLQAFLPFGLRPSSLLQSLSLLVRVQAQCGPPLGCLRGFRRPLWACKGTQPPNSSSIRMFTSLIRLLARKCLFNFVLLCD